MADVQKIGIEIDFSQSGTQGVASNIQALNDSLKNMKDTIGKINFQGLSGKGKEGVEALLTLMTRTQERLNSIKRSMSDYQTGVGRFFDIKNLSGLQDNLRLATEKLQHAKLGTQQFEDALKKLYGLMETKGAQAHAQELMRLEYLDEKALQTTKDYKEMLSIYQSLANTATTDTDRAFYNYKAQATKDVGLKAIPQFVLDDDIIQEKLSKIEDRVRKLNSAGLHITADVSLPELDKIIAQLKNGELELKVKDSTAVNHLKNIIKLKKEFEQSLQVSNPVAEAGSIADLEKQYDRLIQKIRSTNLNSPALGDLKAQASALSQNIATAQEGMRGFNNTLYQSRSAAGSAANVLLQTNYAIRDSAYFFRNGRIDFAFGLQAIGNNLNPIIDGFINLRERSKELGGAWMVLRNTLTGPAGMMMAFSVIVTVLQAFTFMASESKNKTRELQSSLEDLTAGVRGSVDAIRSLQNQFDGLTFNRANDEFRMLTRSIEEMKDRMQETGLITQIWQGLMFKPLTDALGYNFSWQNFDIQEMFTGEKGKIGKQITLSEDVQKKLKNEAVQIRELFQQSNPIDALKYKSSNELQSYLRNLKTIIDDWAKNVPNKDVTFFDTFVGRLDRGKVKNTMDAIQKMISEDKAKAPHTSNANKETWQDWAKNIGLPDPRTLGNDIFKRLGEIDERFGKMRNREEVLYRDSKHKPSGPERQNILGLIRGNELGEMTAYLNEQAKKISEIDEYLGSKSLSQFDNQIENLRHQYKQATQLLSDMKVYLSKSMELKDVPKDIREQVKASLQELVNEVNKKDAELNNSFNRVFTDIKGNEMKAQNAAFDRFSLSIDALAEKALSSLERRKAEIKRSAEGLRDQITEALSRKELTPAGAKILGIAVDKAEGDANKKADMDKKRYMKQDYEALLQQNMMLNILDQSARKVGESLIDAFTGAKLSLSDLAKEIVASTLKMVAMEKITELLAGVFLKKKDPETKKGTKGGDLIMGIAETAFGALTGLGGLITGGSPAGTSLKKKTSQMVSSFSPMQPTMNVELSGGIKVNKNNFVFELARAQKDYDRVTG